MNAWSASHAGYDNTNADCEVHGFRAAHQMDDDGVCIDCKGDEDKTAALREVGLAAKVVEVITPGAVIAQESDDVLTQVTVRVDPRSVLILTGAQGALWSALYVEGGEVQTLPLVGRQGYIRSILK